MGVVTAYLGDQGCDLARDWPTSRVWGAQAETCCRREVEWSGMQSGDCGKILSLCAWRTLKLGSAEESQGRGAGCARCLGCMPRPLSRGGQGWARSIMRSGTGAVVLGKVPEEAEKLRCRREGSGTRSAACIERMKRPEEQLWTLWLAAGGGGALEGHREGR
jgi:hypothetical protein